MENNRYKKSFVFSNKPEDVAGVVSSCADFIEEPRDLTPVPFAVLSRIKWVLTELLINGAKHAGTEESELTISTTDQSVLIEKTDFGNPLQLTVDGGKKVVSWPLSGGVPDQCFEVYQNGMDSLQIRINSDGTAIFSVQELDDVLMPQLLMTTSEHFGLMIIAKASDRFSYYFDKIHKKNIFNVIFNCEE